MSTSTMLILFVIYLAFIIFIVASMWKIFSKAGQPGWACIVPVYNIITLLKIVGKPWWWLLLMCMPVASLIFLAVNPVVFSIVYFLSFIVTITYVIWTYNMLSKSFGKDTGFTAGLVLLGIVFFPILGFGDAKYLGPYGDPAAFAAYGKENGFDFERNIMHS